MKLQLQGDRSLCRQWHVKTRHQHFAKSISNLEFPQRSMLFVAVIEHPVRQIRKLLFFTQLHGLRDQSVCRPLIVVSCLWKKRQYGATISAVDEFQNAG